MEQSKTSFRGKDLSQWLLGFALVLVLTIGLVPVFPQTAEAAGASKTLSYSSSLISKIGTQKSSGHNICCPSFSCAYGDSMLTGTAIAHSKYTCKSCTWPCWGTKSYYQSSTAGIYNQINAGRPVVMHVYNKPGWGKSNGQHWVTVIGYTNVTDSSKMKASNLIALDPYDGKKITVSDRYRLYTNSSAIIHTSTRKVLSKPTIKVANVVGGKKFTITPPQSACTVYYKLYDKSTGKVVKALTKGTSFTITRAGTTTVRCYAVKSGYMKSATASTNVSVAQLKAPSIKVSNEENGKRITIVPAQSGCTVYYKLVNANTGEVIRARTKGASFKINWTGSTKVLCHVEKSGYRRSVDSTKTVYIEAVSSPVITVKSTTTKSAKIGITCSDATQILYTLDGSKPSISRVGDGTTVVPANSATKEYSGAFTVPLGTTIHAIGVNGVDGMKTSHTIKTITGGYATMLELDKSALDESAYVEPAEEEPQDEPVAYTETLWVSLTDDGALLLAADRQALPTDGVTREWQVSVLDSSDPLPWLDPEVAPCISRVEFLDQVMLPTLSGWFEQLPESVDVNCEKVTTDM